MERRRRTFKRIEAMPEDLHSTSSFACTVQRSQSHSQERNGGENRRKWPKHIRRTFLLAMQNKRKSKKINRFHGKCTQTYKWQKNINVYIALRLLKLLKTNVDYGTVCTNTRKNIHTHADMCTQNPDTNLHRDINSLALTQTYHACIAEHTLSQPHSHSARQLKLVRWYAVH